MADEEDLEWSDNLLRSFRRSAFRFETRPMYALSYERADFERFLAGTPTPPTEVDWWRPWLDEIASLTDTGKRIGRVRVLAEPPTDYQRWEMWAAPWHARAGERIGYLNHSRAQEIGLPLDCDWWLLDDERVILMWFTSTGSIYDRELLDDPGKVARFIEWRDLAVQHATTAEHVTAA
jgi:hypothetical protein